MKLSLVEGSRNFTFEVPLAEHQCVTIRPVDRAAKSWVEVTRNALAAPLGTKSPADEDLRGKKVAIIVDDWGRPTPAYKFIPVLLEAVKTAGAADEDITFITASGMHWTMSQEEMERKVGKDIAAKYRCVSHDAGDFESMEFCGFSNLGTPIWVNRVVAEADYVIAAGRVYPHSAYGYEGGYKMIVPGVASYETIVRDHSFNFSPLSTYGELGLKGPSRLEADAVGRLVGIDFLINFVMNSDAEPVAAFGGVVEEVHPKCVAYGDRYVWGVAIGEKADITIASANGDGVNHFAVNMAALATRRGGTVILLVDDEKTPPAVSDLQELPMSDLIRIHEKRDFTALQGRDIQYRIKGVRGEELRRRLYFGSDIQFVFVGGKLSDTTMKLTGGTWFADLQDAVNQCVAPNAETKLIVMPEAHKTLPVSRLFEQWRLDQ